MILFFVAEKKTEKKSDLYLAQPELDKKRIWPPDARRIYKRQIWTTTIKTFPSVDPAFSFIFPPHMCSNKKTWLRERERQKTENQKQIENNKGNQNARRKQRVKNIHGHEIRERDKNKKQWKQKKEDAGPYSKVKRMQPLRLIKTRGGGQIRGGGRESEKYATQW